MITYGLLVIGSGPAGVSAAKAYVTAGGPGAVAILTTDVDQPYMRPPLSKGVLAGDTPAEGAPIGKPLPPHVEVRTGTTVTHVDVGAHTLIAGGQKLSFERLVIATGARNIPFPAAEPDAQVHTLRSLDDARKLVAAAQRSRSALVIGSGFIGCEGAASLARRGIATTMVTPENAPQESRLGPYVSARITSWLQDLGVQVRTGVRVTGIAAPRVVHLDDGSTLSPDLILSAVGITPAAGDLLQGTSLQLHEGRVVVDEYLQAAPGVWVAGDSARAHHGAASRPLAVEHWGDALAMGSLAGRNAAASADEQQPWQDVPGFWSSIGQHTIKYAAWGDGHDKEEIVERVGGFTLWYTDEQDRLVGVLTYNADDDYERGEAAIAKGARLADILHGADG